MAIAAFEYVLSAVSRNIIFYLVMPEVTVVHV